MLSSCNCYQEQVTLFGESGKEKKNRVFSPLTQNGFSRAGTGWQHPLIPQPAKKPKKLYPLPTQSLPRTLPLLNLCPTCRITPNVICLGLIVFSQVACCIMHLTMMRASHEKCYKTGLHHTCHQ